MALVVSKHIELQTNTSIRKFIHKCKKITDVRLKNRLPGKEIRISANLSPEIMEILRKLDMLT
jgi:hypothetical protein